MPLNRNIFKVPQIFGAKFFKKLAEKAKKLNFTIFWALSNISNPRKFIFNKLETLMIYDNRKKKF